MDYSELRPAMKRFWQFKKSMNVMVSRDNVRRDLELAMNLQHSGEQVEIMINSVSEKLSSGEYRNVVFEEEKTKITQVESNG